MDVKYKFLNEINKLSPQEKEISNYILENLNSYKELSLKNISNKIKCEQSAITKTLKKLGFSGLKELKISLDKQFYLDQEKQNDNDYSFLLQSFLEKIITSIKKTNDDLNFENFLKLSKTLLVSNKKIKIFATGKTKIIAQLLFFQLIEMGFIVEIFSSLYDINAFEVEDNIVILISLSGNNSKINRYLNTIYNKKSYKIIAICGSYNFFLDKEVDILIKSNETNFFVDNNKANPFVEKYNLLYLIDLLLLILSINIDEDKKHFKSKIKSNNFIN
ncbi:MurR/RpiR family transcriptional regulator [Spiroplasma tabanidicola]|uniref:MurR/RpiR family transcriptional regulator n=1 Tax=Spiroplasma tabanidicola TaxID=324079 RepID=A0A6I6CJ31_9MOLU|nr:MurR/RpiR family transcriptional regulator [Spiroplasma tabanidicola]QGS52073.1 MurR/RpiR family transcriptional regulator [Spiroplasma tabanidicola]